MVTRHEVLPYISEPIGCPRRLSSQFHLSTTVTEGVVLRGSKGASRLFRETSGGTDGLERFSKRCGKRRGVSTGRLSVHQR